VFRNQVFDSWTDQEDPEGGHSGLEPEGIAVSETEPEIVSLNELLDVEPYVGPLSSVTFGDVNGERVTVDLRSMTFDVYSVDNRGPYWIPIDRCRKPAEVLDWIFQMWGKTWVTTRLMGYIISAFDEALHPQSSLCGEGLPSTIRKSDLANLVSLNLRRLIAEHPKFPDDRVPVTWNKGESE
jgi:hypothetical protein